MSGLTKSELLRRLEVAGVRPSKALGQNFLIDANVAQRIARLASGAGSRRYIEVGPGAGALTVALAPMAEAVLAIEADRYVIPILFDVLAQREISNVKVLHQDVMDFSWCNELDQGESYCLCANLPYNIAATLIVRILEEVPSIDRLVVMVQDEVGRRIASDPGTRQYSGVSAKVAYWATTKIAFSVSPSVFFPQPNVESVVIDVTRRAVAPISEATYGLFSDIIKAGFSRRRQMLRRSLAGIADIGILDSVGIEPSLRAEKLSYLDFLKIAEALVESDRGRE